MGRAPCCEKVGLRRGRWTAEEDEILTKYIQQNGEGNWRPLPKRAGLLRCGKSCRLRWINYLRSDLKRGNISREEEEIMVKLHTSFGNRWSFIAEHLPGRTDNEIKNYWNTHLSRRVYCYRKEIINGCPLTINPQKTTGRNKKRGDKDAIDTNPSLKKETNEAKNKQKNKKVDRIKETKNNDLMKETTVENSVSCHDEEGKSMKGCDLETETSGTEERESGAFENVVKESTELDIHQVREIGDLEREIPFQQEREILGLEQWLDIDDIDHFSLEGDHLLSWLWEGEDGEDWVQKIMDCDIQDPFAACIE